MPQLKPTPQSAFLQNYRRLVILLLAACLSAFGTAAFQTAAAERILATKVGKASYYGKGFNGRKTASGERFNSNHAVAAHPSWPFGTLVRVTNLRNGRAVKVRIIDRGPSRRMQRKGRIIDLSRGTARRLGFLRQGVARVKLEVLKWGKKR
jgi:rare lipoprotein A